MRKICIVTGNRADYSRLKSVISAVGENPDLELILIASASHLLDDFGKTINNIKKDGFKVDNVVRSIIEGEDLVSMAKSVGLGVLEFPSIFEQYMPDIVVIVGDRFDAYSIAISSALMNIPLAHIQGGEVTGTIDESIRHSITKLAHIHFPSTQQSAERIIKMGERPDRVFNVGCPTFDEIANLNFHSRGEICEKYKLNPNEPFIILAHHPVTTEFSKTIEHEFELLDAIYSLNFQTIMLYPNVDAGSKDMVKVIRNFELKYTGQMILKYKHIDFEDYIQLLKYCDCIVGNSSSGIRESCYFGTPAVNIGTRQSGRERGHNVIDVDYNCEDIKNAVIKAIEHGKFDDENIYGDGNAGKQIADILSTIKIKSIQKKICY